MSNENQYNETLLISEEMLKLYSPLSKDISVDKIYPFVGLAQSYFILPILGKPLLQKLQYEIETDSLTDDDKALIVKIAQPLSFYSCYLGLRSLSYTISEKGITKLHSENSETITEKELGEFMLSLKNQAEMAQQLLIDYLCDCSDNYPLWKPINECQCNKRNFDKGRASRDFRNLIYFPNKPNGKCDCN